MADDPPEDYSDQCNNPAVVLGPSTSLEAYGHFHAVGLVREPFATPIRPYCLRDHAEVWGQAMVTAPDGSQVTARVQPLARRSVDVVFEASTHGWYHLEIEFLPRAMAITREVLVAKRSAALPEIVLPRSCPALLRAGRGAWICGDQVLREGRVVMSLPASTNLIAGDFVWSLDASRSQIVRFEDLGTGGLALRGMLEIDFPPRTGFYAAATGTELVLKQGAKLMWFGLAGNGTLQKRAERTTNSGSHIALAQDLVLAEESRPDGSRILAAYRLQPWGQITEEGPAKPAHAVSSDGAGLWAIYDQLFYAVPETTAGVRQLGALTFPFEAETTFGPVPVLRLPRETAVLVPEGDEIVLEVLATQSISGATSAFYWSTLEDGTTKVFIR